MCGIAGFVGKGDRDDLLAMTAALKHRGPDGQGVWVDSESGVHLGHTRLVVIDPLGGQQPMTSEDGLVTIVYNGEIYNHSELRRELEREGHRFRSSHSDTEVLLNGYRQWGNRLPQRLNGMWAFAIFDQRRKRIFLSRDRFGQKPLFYTRQNGLFAFASELSAFPQHREICPSVSTLSLQKYLAYGFIPAPNSLYQSIYKLPGGHNLELDTQGLNYQLAEYWRFQLRPEQESSKRTVHAWAEELHVLLRSAVERQMQSDVPLGVFLSGGLDSSCIAAMASTLSSASPIQTFSVGFDDPQFDETRYAERVASLIGAEHHMTRIAMRELPSLAARAVENLDEPLGDNSLVPTYFLCQSARSRVTVALGGDGADELLAGYDPFRIVQLANRYARWTPKPVHRAIRTVVGMLPSRQGYMSFDFKLKRLMRGLEYPAQFWNPVWLGPLEPSELRECFSDPVDLEEVYSEAIGLWDDSAANGVVEKTMQFYVRLYLQDDILVKIDRASMMCSLELRSPFLDLDVVDFLSRVPTRFKLHRGCTKILLREAARRMLPTEITQRKKHGFPFPAAHSFQQRHLQVDLGLPVPFRRSFVVEKEKQHVTGCEDNRMFLWCHWLLSRYRDTLSKPASNCPLGTNADVGDCVSDGGNAANGSP